MPPAVISDPARQLAAAALFESGASIRSVAKQLNIDKTSAWRLRHQALADPELVQVASKTIADKMLLASSGSVDELLDRVESGTLNTERAVDLAKIASICLQSAGAYAALSGNKDMMSSMMNSYGISESHSSSRVTLEQKITVETGRTAQAAPQVIDLPGSHTPK